MNIDSRSYAVPEWPLPSPTKTPVTTSFFAGQTSPLGLPQSSPSHFQDAFMTPLSAAYTTPRQSQNPFSAVPIQRPTSTGSQKRLRVEDPQFHTHHADVKGGALSLPPVDPSRRLTSSPNPGTSQDAFRTAVAPAPLRPSPDLGSLNIDKMEQSHHQMQTPPPTRDSSVRRKAQAQQAYAAALNTPTVGTRRTFTTPRAIHTGPELVGPAPTQASPFHIPQLQFSPDVYQFTNTGPLTAPVLGQPRSFWDNGSGLNSMNMDWANSLQDPFTALPADTAAFNWDLAGPPQAPRGNVAGAAAGIVPQQRFSTAEQQQQTIPKATLNPSPEISQGPSHSFVSGAPGVDPSLLFNRVTSARENVMFNKPKPNPPPAPSDDLPAGRQPYEQQAMMAKREEMERLMKLQNKHAGSVGPTSASLSASATKPTLGRSQTYSGPRPSSGSAAAAAKEAFNIDRRTSPLKRASQSSLSSIPELGKNKRRSVILTVDEDGHARTETKIVEESDSELPAVPVPRKVQRYSAFLADDSDDSSEEENQDMPLPSRHSSFNFASLGVTSGQRASKTSSTVSNRTSIASTGSADRRLSALFAASGGGMRRSFSMTSSQKRPISGSRRQSSFGSSAGDNFATVDTDVLLRSDEPESSAHGALKEVIEGRARRREEKNSQQRFMDPQFRYWGQPVQPQSSAQSTPARLRPSHSSSSFPSTPADTVSPSVNTAPSSYRGAPIRCICHNNIDTGTALMIQCEKCFAWLHIPCLGVMPEQLPPAYVCGFCTGHLPPQASLMPSSMGRKAGFVGGNTVSPLGMKGGRQQ